MMKFRHRASKAGAPKAAKPQETQSMIVERARMEDKLNWANLHYYIMNEIEFQKNSSHPEFAKHQGVRITPHFLEIVVEGILVDAGTDQNIRTSEQNFGASHWLTCAAGMS